MTNKEHAQYLSSRVMAFDADGCAACYAADGALITPTGTYRGTEELKAYFEEWFASFSDIDIDDSAMLGENELLLVEAKSQLTHTAPLNLPDGQMLEPTGRRITVRAMEALEFADGVIREHRLYYDPQKVLDQLLGQ
jgi:hypothetical protein